MRLSRALVCSALLASQALVPLAGAAAQERAELSSPGSEAAAPDLAQALRWIATGRSDRALPVLDALAAEPGPDRLRARFERARLHEARGEWARAEPLYAAQITSYNARSDLSSAELVAVALSCRRLGREDPQLFQDALRAYDEALQADPANLEAQVGLADLFLEKYDGVEARGAAQRALGIDPESPDALLTMAEVLHFEGSPQALELTEEIVAETPEHVAALVFLGRLRLELEDREGARQAAERALAANPESVAARAVLAAAAILDQDEDLYQGLRREALDAWPGESSFLTFVAEVCVQNRLYERARDLALEATRLRPDDWSAWAELGLNNLRLGRIEEGQAQLEKAFAGDPFNVWNKNTLDLLDTLPEYVTLETERFQIVAHRDEAELMHLLVAPLAERAYDALAERYGYRPETPIRIEIYPRHADFSVRTVGLAGLGALGVSFGPVVAIDSPSGREVGEYHWASTLWHEIAHTFTLGLTEGRIPRWLTEGLSVVEERRASTGWGREARPEFLQAFADGRLRPLGEINSSFVRPRTPDEIGLAYYQSSLLCEVIEEEYGWPRMLEMIRAFRDGSTTEEVAARVLGTDLAHLDELFHRSVEERFASALPSFPPAPVVADEEEEEEPNGEPTPGRGVVVARPVERPHTPGDLEKAALERPDDYRAQLLWGRHLVAEERWAEAREPLARAVGLFPEFTAPGSAYDALAEVYEATDDHEALTALLQRQIDQSERSLAEHRRLAELYRAAGQAERELAVLERLPLLYPFDPGLHERLAELHRGFGDAREEVRARRAVLALDPPSRPRAGLELARALIRAGDREAARRVTLRVLEEAPGFVEAQDLLLELVGESS